MRVELQRRRWPIVVLFLAVLACAAYAGRRPIAQAVVAVAASRSHIFAEPPELAMEPLWERIGEEAQFYWDIAGWREARSRRLKQLEPSLRPLIAEVNRREAAGQGMQYSMHIYREIRWRLNFTPDVEATKARIADLRESLNQPEKQKEATEQQASDGSWAMGIDVWWLKLYYSVEDGIDEPNVVVRYPLTFLDRINAPERLTAQLDSARMDDFTRTGVVNREQLDETFSAMARLLFKVKHVPYNFDPRLGDALRDYVARWQDPTTGYWGQWLIDRQGRIWKMDDMAMTFHVVSDLKGQVPHLDKIARHTLELDRVNFPAGIRFDGHYENHLNWDVVRILTLAWPQLDEPTRQKARGELSRMLHWCLHQSLQPNGSFKTSDLDDTQGDADFYGVLFLRDLGYFQRERRFWTNEDFPDAKAVHDRLEARLGAAGLNDPNIKSAYDALHEMDSAAKTH
jgi:hypothetical protein